MFADSRYADIENKCRYADIADADINIGTPLVLMELYTQNQLRKNPGKLKYQTFGDQTSTP